MDEPNAPAQHALRLPFGTDAAAVARAYVAEHAGSIPPDLAADAQLLVSEIVTNAVRHGRPEIVLQLRVDPVLIGVEVSDEGGSGHDVLIEHPDPQRAGGRGLLIVDALSSRWGVVEHDPPPGKTVWFELRTTD